MRIFQELVEAKEWLMIDLTRSMSMISVGWWMWSPPLVPRPPSSKMTICYQSRPQSYRRLRQSKCLCTLSRVCYCQKESLNAKTRSCRKRKK
jgi:hypothetical protein